MVVLVGYQGLCSKDGIDNPDIDDRAYLAGSPDAFQLIEWCSCFTDASSDLPWLSRMLPIEVQFSASSTASSWTMIGVLLNALVFNAELSLLLIVPPSLAELSATMELCLHQLLGVRWKSQIVGKSTALSTASNFSTGSISLLVHRSLNDPVYGQKKQKRREKSSLTHSGSYFETTSLHKTF
ncbi:hypothetical protein DPMN_135532 [Dreissena polymorpha]|uniref:Uncharacterized protein n=1 Tax=Dreissena polymorpha TaxID=45954 RepID=A0A9D4JER9_DREPO|nr:hypothetical protein DPMN_135532 [Dreissena polymorpha]